MTACDFLLDFDGVQCSNDGDCRRFASTAVCIQGACRPSDADGAVDGASIDDGAPVESASGDDAGSGDAAPLGPPGCFTGTPATDREYLNQCTTSQYLAFDNCARLGLCGDAAPPAPVAPSTADAGTSDASVTLPTVGCYDATARPKPIFIQGGGSSFVKAMAPIVAQNGYTIVDQSTSSCAGAGAGGFAPSPANLMTNPATASQPVASYYDATGKATPCLLGNSPRSPDHTTEITDIGLSDIFSTTCSADWVAGGSAFPDVGEFAGPITPYIFVTPPGSSQRAISAEAAHMVFGLGGDDGVTVPWTDPTAFWIRPSSAGVINVLSIAIDLPINAWWGNVAANNTALQSAILATSQASAEKTIGTLSSDYADPVKTSLHILYFQATGQLAGFLPDSTPSAIDKRNVRDGHYAPWGAVHLYTPLVNGQPSATAQAFIVPFTVANQQFLDAIIPSGYIPQCAMRVRRTVEMGPLQADTPSFECDCYYDFKTTGATTCQACAGSGQCPASQPVCNLGYCEVQ